MDVEEVKKLLRSEGVSEADLEVAVDRRIASDYNPTTAKAPPALLKNLGPVSRKPNWGGNDSILQVWTFPELMQEGFITSTDPDEMDFDEQFQPFHDGVLQSLMNIFNTPDLADREIHRIFQYEMWQGLHWEDYNEIRPALKLASCMLEEPSMMTFFNGLIGQPWKNVHMSDTMKANHPGEVFQYFEPSDAFDPAAAQCGFDDIWELMINMSKYIKWEFGPVDGAYGVTTADVYKPGMRGYATQSSVITMNEHYLEVLSRLKQATDITPWISHDDSLVNGPAVMRAHFCMAVTMMHELCHAICYSVTPFRHMGTQEPFLRDMRKNELGHAYEVMAFGGVFGGIGQSSEETEKYWEYPFGVSLRDWPNLVDDEVIGSLFKWGKTHWTRHAVRNKHLHQFFTERFWQVDVERYQYWAWQIPEEQKTHGVMLEGPTDYVAGESPRPGTFLPPPETRVEAIRRLDAWREVLRIDKEAQEELEAEAQFPWLETVLEENLRRYLAEGKGDAMDAS